MWLILCTNALKILHILKLTLTNLHHCILHQLVQVFVPFMSIFILKVTTHCEHDVICAVVASLSQNGPDEGIDSLINIVVEKALVILC